MGQVTLTEFLTARIHEDQAVAREVEEKTRRPERGLPDYYEHADTSAARIIWDVDYGQGGYTITAARVLAECEAKRLVVSEHRLKAGGGCTTCANGALDEYGIPEVDPKPWPCPTLQYLTLPYADHPDYDEAWRP